VLSSFVCDSAVTDDSARDVTGNEAQIVRQRLVVDCILIEHGELLERIVPGTRPRVETSVVLASLLVDCPRRDRSARGPAQAAVCLGVAELNHQRPL
jgi:hypothetical protein